ncbi:MAG TPA: aminoglycoside phosphotransferase family protein [Rhizomicrobium sp.]|nr:aminoglycoside phosphotransferase family protein [Rhizomicrobium sp.]
MSLNAPSEILEALSGMGLVAPGSPCQIKPLGGGVSCDVFEIRCASRTICVKRALEKLRVAAEWRAPAERSQAEVAWFRLVAAIDPRWVPAVLGEDRARHLFAMEFLPPESHPVWKSLLAEGEADPAFAARVGEVLAKIHACTAGSEVIARQFRNNAQFHALRTDAYLFFTAAKHPDVAPSIRAMADGLCRSRIALMHGDVSPKNILVGPDGPVFIDAETCCYGDPAFDLAFCLNHLLLKGVWHPEHAAGYGKCFASLAGSYFSGVTWEDRRELECRAAGLLSAFLLARIDGKSPVEYVTSDLDKAFVRAMAKDFLNGRATALSFMLDRWTEALSIRQM